MFLKKLFYFISSIALIYGTPYTPPPPLPCTSSSPPLTPQLTLPPQGPPRDVPIVDCQLPDGLKCNMCNNITTFNFKSATFQYQACIFEFKYVVFGYLPLTLGIEVDNMRWITATCSDSNQNKPILRNENGDTLDNVLSIGETVCGPNTMEVDLYFPGFEWIGSGLLVNHFVNDHNFTIQL